MADFLQITQPLSPQTYNPQLKPPVQNDGIFDLFDMSKVIKSSDRTQQNEDHTATGEGSKSLVKLPLMLAKDPQFASMVLKGIVAKDVLAGLASGENPELLEKLTAFANEIMLTPEQLVGEMMNQGKESTLFNGPFFDLLRQLSARAPEAGEAGIELKNAIAAILRNVANATQQGDILKSLAGNLRFLAQEMAPSKQLAGRMEELASKLLLLAAGNKGGASAPVTETFQELRSQLQQVMQEASSSLLATDQLKNLSSLMTHTMSRYSTNERGLADSFQNLMDMLVGKELKTMLKESFQEYVVSSELPLNVKNTIVRMPEDGFAKLAMSLASMAEQGSRNLDAPALTGKIAGHLMNLQRGIAAGRDEAMLTFQTLKDILGETLPSEGKAGLNQLLSGFQGDRNLNNLLDHLSNILNQIQRMDVKLPLARGLNEVLGRLAKAEGINYEPPTAMESLVNFLSKNMNDGALRALGGLNQQEMAAGMLMAPGVFTPLLHYLIPVEMGDFRAFGELWVDPEAGKDSEGSGGDIGPVHHLFLTFNVEKLGDFELEVVAIKEELAISLHCPPDFTKGFKRIKDNLVRIASDKGYNLQSSRVEPLKRRRDLIEVFPKLAARRAGLNAVV